MEQWFLQQQEGSTMPWSARPRGCFANKSRDWVCARVRSLDVNYRRRRLPPSRRCIRTSTIKSASTWSASSTSLWRPVSPSDRRTNRQRVKSDFPCRRARRRSGLFPENASNQSSHVLTNRYCTPFFHGHALTFNAQPNSIQTLTCRQRSFIIMPIIFFYF